MAAFTTDVTASDGTWTAVSASKNFVIITNKTSSVIYYAVAATSADLAAVTGHPLNRLETVELSFLGTGGNNVFVRATGAGSTYTVSAY